MSTRRAPRLALRAGLIALFLIAMPMPASRGAQHESSRSEPPCLEPHPCDYLWEGADQTGPFELARVEEVWVETHDYEENGTLLHGWLAFPDLPEGMRAPVALHSSPYIGFCHPLARGCVPTPGDASFWTDRPDPGVVRAWGVPPVELIRRGYVAAFFDVRGTGSSEGCLDWGGARETQDQKVLVDWLASQDWSNGRIGMGGNSYPAATAWQAAIQAPQGLKTIITAGIVTDWYFLDHTPQGMRLDISTPFDALIELGTSWLPHAGAGGDPAGDIVQIADRAADPGCTPFAFTTDHSTRAFLVDREAESWGPRRYTDRLNQVRASVLVPHGLGDIGHMFQDLNVWEGLHGSRTRPHSPRLRCPPRAPRCADPALSPLTWQISGQWGHGPPFAGSPPLPPGGDGEWSTILFDWLGYWLQGVGEPPPHRVDYQDTSGVWHSSSAWPPAEAREEALYLDGDRLTTAPGEGDQRFRSAPSPGNNHATFHATFGLHGLPPHALWAWCRQEGSTADRVETAVAYVSDPLEHHSLLAGNPFAYLELSSEQPDGVVGVALLRWPAGTPCADLSKTAQLVAAGGADLRYHEGGYTPRSFDTSRPTRVRIDLFNAAVSFEPGDRLIVVASGSEAVGEFQSVQPTASEVTVHADVSHVVVPFVSGGLGGTSSGLEYPPSPAAPR